MGEASTHSSSYLLWVDLLWGLGFAVQQDIKCIWSCMGPSRILCLFLHNLRFVFQFRWSYADRKLLIWELGILALVTHIGSGPWRRMTTFSFLFFKVKGENIANSIVTLLALYSCWEGPYMLISHRPFVFF